MNTLKAMESFVAVAEHNGFAPAARALGTSTTAVSRYVQELEDWLGAELFRRTTRKVSLTEMGQAQLVKCQGILGDVASLQSEAQTTDAEPSGTVKLTAPVFIAKRFLADLLPSFLNTYSELEVDLLAVDREVDFVSEGIDVALRIGKLADSTIVARKIRDVALQLVCSPDYVERHGKPGNVSELAEHNCLVDTVPGFADRWPIRDDSFKRNYRAKGNLRANSGEVVETLALNGAGIAYIPDFFVMRHIAEGRLIQLLTDLHAPTRGMYLAYPQTSHVSPKVRAFIDFFLAHISQLDMLYSAEADV